MVVPVVPKLGYKVSRALSGSSLAGSGMLIRLRSSTLGILGLVAATGLALIAFASLQGWPGVLTGPLPQAPGPDLIRNDPIVAPAGEPAAGIVGRRIASRSTSRRQRSRPPRSGGASALTVGRQVDPGAGQPQPVAPPSPEASPPGAAADDAQPAPASNSPSVESAPANARPATSGNGSTPVAAGSDESTDQSGPGHGKHHGSGPPSWAGPDESGPPGHTSWEGDGNPGGHDDDWGHGHGHGHDRGWGRH